ncbi:hypothetical protein ABZ249_25485 [Nocardiopsis sp. NPDC006139]|uniref:hypothetical protein n=1 Tax=Nocardiopsis sp. NPDC006139 TaxID=3154578 RepID=UPI0033B88DF5
MTAERAVTTYLQEHGFPDAVDTLARITGTGPVHWQVADRDAEHAGDALVADWLEETRTAATTYRAHLGILVTPRADHGPARVASWWAHVDVGALARAMRGRLVLPEEVSAGMVRMHLSTAVLLARAAGYGAPLGMGAAA